MTPLRRLCTYPVTPRVDRARLRTMATLARRAAEAMWADDAASQALGMTLDDIEPGYAALSMTVRADMINGHAMCHGGFIFTLADSAFAFAANSHNRRTVAQSCDVTFLSPAREGDVLRAVARERYRDQRRGVYDVTVTCGDQTIAEFRGHAREIPGTLL